MQKAFEKIVERLGKKAEDFGIGIANGAKFVRLESAIEIVNKVADEYKSRTMIDGQYCWQTCACTEKCNDCNRLSEGYIDWYENLDDWETEYKQEVTRGVFDKIINYINFEIARTESFAEHDTQINILNYVQQMQEEYKSNDGWIPCSSGERPVVPEGKDYVDVLITTLPYFHYETENNWEASEYYEGIGFNTQKTVIAWRYSIQPYAKGK